MRRVPEPQNESERAILSARRNAMNKSENPEVLLYMDTDCPHDARIVQLNGPARTLFGLPGEPSKVGPKHNLLSELPFFLKRQSSQDAWYRLLDKLHRDIGCREKLSIPALGDKADAPLAHIVHARPIEITSTAVSGGFRLLTLLDVSHADDLAKHDPVIPDVYFRAYGIDHMEGLIEEESPFALLLFDLDNLDLINKHLGHGVGDRYLRTLGSVIRAKTRDTDLLWRYGGDEVVATLPLTKDLVDFDGHANERARAIVYAFTEACNKLNLSKFTITTSVGVAQVTKFDPAPDMEAIFNSASRQCMEHKASKLGRPGQISQLASKAG